MTPKHGGLRHQLANVKRMCMGVSGIELFACVRFEWYLCVCVCVFVVFEEQEKKCCTSYGCLFRSSHTGHEQNEKDKCLFNSVFLYVGNEYQFKLMNTISFNVAFGSLSIFLSLFLSVCPFFTLYYRCVVFFFLLQIPLNAFYHLDKLYNF